MSTRKGTDGALRQAVSARGAWSIGKAAVGFPWAVAEVGFRRCYRRTDTFHAVSNLRCDCLRVELPVEARAASSGALGTPDRDTTCEECGGSGKTLVWIGLACSERRCPVCAGKGGLSPADARRSRRDDRAVREQLSKARAAGKIGVKS